MRRNSPDPREEPDFVQAGGASPHEVDPAARAIAEQLLEELEVPRRVKFTPSQLARDVGGTARSWQRACELGQIGAVRIPGGWLIPWSRLVSYFATHQRLVSKN